MLRGLVRSLQRIYLSSFAPAFDAGDKSIGALHVAIARV
jgi:beta-glucosidase-like glycosyl hydrolase